jgi:hypothetical protein
MIPPFKPDGVTDQSSDPAEWGGRGEEEKRPSIFLFPSSPLPAFLVHELSCWRFVKLVLIASNGFTP